MTISYQVRNLFQDSLNDVHASMLKLFWYPDIFEAAIMSQNITIRHWNGSLKAT